MALKTTNPSTPPGGKKNPIPDTYKRQEKGQPIRHSDRPNANPHRGEGGGESDRPKK
jgi:hypothetical protein